MSKQQMCLKDEEEKVSTMLFFYERGCGRVKEICPHGHPLLLCSMEKPWAELILALQPKSFKAAENNMSRACYFA